MAFRIYLYHGNEQYMCVEKHSWPLGAQTLEVLRSPLNKEKRVFFLLKGWLDLSVLTQPPQEANRLQKSSNSTFIEQSVTKGNGRMRSASRQMVPEKVSFEGG